MRFSGHQPQYFPRLHYFARMLESDVFELSDYLQFVPKHAFPLPGGGWKRDKSHQAHTPIKLSSGIHYLVIPIFKGIYPINRTKINYDQSWIKDHLGTIESAYGKSSEFKRIFPEIQQLFEYKYDSLAELNIKTTIWGLMRILGDTSTVVKNCNLSSLNKLLVSRNPFRLKQLVIISQTPIKPPSDEKDATSWILEMARYFGADEYFHGGTSAVAYLNADTLRKNGIKLVQQNWIARVYSQQFMKLKFIPNLSIIDLLMNVPSSNLSAYFQESKSK